MKLILSLTGFACLFGMLPFCSPLLAETPLQIESAQIRMAPPGAPASAYFTLSNISDHPVTITRIDADWAGMIMIHESRVENGMAKMRELKTLSIPAHGHVTLQPGGIHIMLMEPKVLHEGEQRILQLGFADGTHQSVQLPVGK